MEDEHDINQQLYAAAERMKNSITRLQASCRHLSLSAYESPLRMLLAETETMLLRTKPRKAMAPAPYAGYGKTIALPAKGTFTLFFPSPTLPESMFTKGTTITRR
ncbi:hypothetical protein ACFPVX_16885 [Cohnella faecalis]|uniref:Uncharacterized protein n=1 Tax=Cohnella faecalis TaxID=2315694 RepID=A0A398CNJ3_9BACL|nr:hypothetical protein [Cohnella faecalis]RIE02819.1 hypothetical protein D3H35_19495 [Cohnella faecalis]